MPKKSPTRIVPNLPPPRLQPPANLLPAPCAPPAGLPARRRPVAPRSAGLSPCAPPAHRVTRRLLVVPRSAGSSPRAVCFPPWMLSFRHGPPPPMRFHRAGRVTSSSPNHRQGQFRVSPTPARLRSPTPSPAGPHPPQLNTSDPAIGPFPTAPTKLHAPAVPKEWSHQAAATGSAHPAPFLERLAAGPLCWMFPSNLSSFQAFFLSYFSSRGQIESTEKYRCSSMESAHTYSGRSSTHVLPGKSQKIFFRYVTF
jgi:hypothetical protein